MQADYILRTRRMKHASIRHLPRPRRYCACTPMAGEPFRESNPVDARNVVTYNKAFLIMSAKVSTRLPNATCRF